MQASRGSRDLVALAQLIALQLLLELTFARIAPVRNTIHTPSASIGNPSQLWYVTLSYTRRLTDTKQAPKTNCTPAKLTAALTYMQNSRVAHTLKDLEKHLPSVAQINGMQVKGIVAPFS